jgi:hypothetical protein
LEILCHTSQNLLLIILVLLHLLRRLLLAPRARRSVAKCLDSLLFLITRVVVVLAVGGPRIVEGTQVAAAALAEAIGVIRWRGVGDPEGGADVGVAEAVGL